MIRNQFDLHFFFECEAAVTKIIIIIIIDDDITVYIIINVRRETFSGSFVPNFTLLSFSKLQNIASPFSNLFFSTTEWRALSQKLFFIHHHHHHHRRVDHYLLCSF